MRKQNIYKAFSNEQRLRLLLCIKQPKCVTELLSHCSLTQSALSQHLKVLRETHIVKTKRRGKEIVYQARDSKVTKLAASLLNFK